MTNLSVPLLPTQIHCFPCRYPLKAAIGWQLSGVTAAEIVADEAYLAAISVTAGINGH
jgi:hypothetical protein